MTNFLIAAFKERDLIETEIEGLVDFLVDEELPPVHLEGADIRIKLMSQNLNSLDAMIADHLVKMDFEIILTDINNNLSEHRR